MGVGAMVWPNELSLFWEKQKLESRKQKCLALAPYELSFVRGCAKAQSWKRAPFCRRKYDKIRYWAPEWRVDLAIRTEFRGDLLVFRADSGLRPRLAGCRRQSVCQHPPVLPFELPAASHLAPARFDPLGSVFRSGWIRSPDERVKGMEMLAKRTEFRRTGSMRRRRNSKRDGLWERRQAH
jgi:hypothetical protein